MSSRVDFQKFKDLLDASDIYVCEYYTIDHQCVLLKTFLGNTFELLLIYVPSRFRFDAPPSPNVTELEVLRDDAAFSEVQPDDYSHTRRSPNYRSIKVHNQPPSLQSTLMKQYERNIVVENVDEPITRRIKRQLSRLTLPFKNIQYNIAIQCENFIVVSFDDDSELYKIKCPANQRPPSTERFIMYFVTLPDFIDKIETIHHEIDTIRRQFYEIVHKAMVESLDSIRDHLDDYTRVKKRIIANFRHNNQVLSDLIQTFLDTKTKETQMIDQFKHKLASTTNNVVKVSYEKEARQSLNKINQAKSLTVKQGIERLVRFHSYFLWVEEATFDNSVMLQRVAANFQRMYQMLNDDATASSSNFT